MKDISAEDVAAIKAQGDFDALLAQISGRATAKPAPAQPTEDQPAPYRITHVGGWPLGTAASGPTPPPDVCTCAKCGGNPAARHNCQPQSGEVA
ncbi:hypothetical protein [Streptomyces sp. CBMA152]|uniref:hypothetical protein n=1 Tax=Streptomyces sp. CBMA152 TaxID=1896312 RepID=UPI0016600796|nr:hypothetical protein [Streptomyces sp. CBMA152]MBD0743520.1 hypothetical protein [Streptomyces sp. CBMA152]